MTIKGILIVVYLDLLMPLAVFLNVYLYFYPVFHFCSFHSPPDGTPAPFRLLALGDPQLEGDTTLRRYASQHKPGDPLLSYLDPQHLSRDFHRYRKIIDLWGNDLYLSHIYKTMRRQLDPTHTVVLGDLIGSQWIGDEEFRRRGDRFWEVFSGGNKVNASDLEAGNADAEHWKYKVITLPGNHDIGYAGDMNRGRVDRFVDMFGPINYDLTVTPPHDGAGDATPSLKLVVLNSMTLDEPILDPTLRKDSYALINRLESHTTENPNPKEATVLLTHLPFHKQSGVCVDAPFFTYFPAGQGGGIKEQNHLSAETSSRVLSSFFGTPVDGKQAGIILTGHDHEGCDVRHARLEEGWNATRWEHLPMGLEKKKLQETEAAKGGVREVTVQSMMGGYGGNAGLVSAWWDEKAQSWRFEYSTCALGTQYVWWGVHVVDIICVVAGFLLYSAHQRDAARNVRKAAAVQEMLDAQKKEA